MMLRLKLFDFLFFLFLPSSILKPIGFVSLWLSTSTSTFDAVVGVVVAAAASDGIHLT